MGILAKAKQLNNGYFLFPYALMGKASNKSKTVRTPFGEPPADVQNGNGHSAFIPKDKNRFTSSARILLGKIHTIEKIFAQKAELSYRDITAILGHSSKTTAANLKELKAVLEKPLKSTYHINVEYDGKPFILCYEFLFNEKLQLDEGQAPVQLTDLEATLICIIVNHKLNPKKSGSFVASVNNVAKALNIPHSTAKSLIDRLTQKGVCTRYRQFTDKKGNVITVKDDNAKTKNEKTLLTVHSRIIRRCNVIYKEYKKRLKDKAEQRDVGKNGKDKRITAADKNQPNKLTDEEKFDVIEAKFIRDEEYLSLTEKYKAFKKQSLEALFKEKDEAKFDALEKTAGDTFKRLCDYLCLNGVNRQDLPIKFAQLICKL